MRESTIKTKDVIRVARLASRPVLNASRTSNAKVTRPVRKSEKLITKREEKVEKKVVTIKKSRLNFKRLGGIFVCITFMVVAVLKFDVFGQGMSALNDTTIKNKVAKLVMPLNGEPKIYKIQNPEPLREKSEFYKDVESGDVVLVYSDTKKVLIYRDSVGKIVNYGSSLDMQ